MTTKKNRLRLRAKRPSDAEPSPASIARYLDKLVLLGEERKFNIQLSGGEPTVRDDLPEIIRLCKAKGFEYVQLNTNGRRLGEDTEYAKTLKAAGLSAVFLQFDGVDDDIYRSLRGEPLLAVKTAAIKNCGSAGLPVTLVPTILKSVNLARLGAIIDFMLANVSIVKGVHFQPASFFGRRPDERNSDGDFDERVTMFAVMKEIEKQTDGRISMSSLAPISTGHPLCCFCATFIKEPSGVLQPVSGGGSCCGSSVDPLDIVRRDRDFVLNKWEVAASERGGQCACGPASSFEEAADATPTSTESKRALAPRAEPTYEAPTYPESTYEAPTRAETSNAAMSFDEAIMMFKTNMFTISGMAFMDETNLDAERLRRCRVQVFTPDERLVPFCGYYAVHVS